MNEIIINMLERRSYRRYKQEQVPDELLNQILEVGLYAPNAGSGQRTKMVAVQDKELNLKLGKLNSAAMPIRKVDSNNYVSKTQQSIIDDPSILNGFYDAPTVITIFALKDFYYSSHDSSMIVENMSLAAHSLGLGSCIIGRAKETFDNDFGQQLLKQWKLENYEPIIHLVVGYPIGEAHVKPRKVGRVRVIK